MQIHPIRTGTVSVHERQREGRGYGLRRSARTLLDRHWTTPLPIYAWLIEHPEGPILVDTGETARTATAGYLPRWHPYYRLAVRFHVRPDARAREAAEREGVEIRYYDVIYKAVEDVKQALELSSPRGLRC